MKRLFALLFIVLISVSATGQKVKEISRNWTPFSQSLEIQTDSVKKFKVIAHAKVETTDIKAWAGVWARVDNKPDQGRGFFDNMGNRPIKSSEWNSYVVEGIIDSKSKKLSFGAICSNNGKFFFDKFELYIEDDAGEYQAVEIENASFESKIVENVIPEWKQGIAKGEPYTVKEFSFNTSDDRVDGDYSIVVEGKGISEKTGTAEASMPNMGIYISIVFILILILPLMTYRSSVEGDKWSKLGKVGFRFSFIYFLLIIFFHNNGAYPYFYYISKWPSELMQKIAIWFGEDIVGIPYKINVGPNGSGDTTYDYLVVFVVFTIAVLGTVIWSALDRKRPNYKKMYYWLTTGVRYYVGLMLISYGLVKVIQLQFPDPSFYRLIEPYGESSPMGLAWTFLGFSEGYNLFMGIAEVLAGLLLFRRTMTFGAVITLMTTMNVMAVNYFYDVPVKVLSTHLVIMTLFLLSRDLRKVMEYLLTSKPVEKLTTIVRPKLPKAINISMKVFKVLILGYALGYGFYSALESRELYGSKAPKPPLYGVYEVTNFNVNGEEITNYKDERLWENMRFERAGSVSIKTRNKKSLYYQIEVDTTTQKIKFSSRSSSEPFYFNYTIKDKTLNFNYIYQNDTISGTTQRLGKEDFLLTNRGFHWVSESPFNR